MSNAKARNDQAVDIKFKESEVSVNDDNDGNEMLITRNSEDMDK